MVDMALWIVLITDPSRKEVGRCTSARHPSTILVGRLARTDQLTAKTLLDEQNMDKSYAGGGAGPS
jgi:hypothetical protein